MMSVLRKQSLYGILIHKKRKHEVVFPLNENEINRGSDAQLRFPFLSQVSFTVFVKVSPLYDTVPEA